MKATFENSINVLVKAYLNDTLQHNNCYACAVGNLVAAANRFQYCQAKDMLNRLALVQNQALYAFDSNDTTSVGGNWYDLLDRAGSNPLNNNKGLPEIESTGYTLDQIDKIEWAFERAARGNSSDEYMFNGLMAVVDVLAEIHKVDLTTKEDAKKMFVKMN